MVDSVRIAIASAILCSLWGASNAFADIEPATNSGSLESSPNPAVTYDETPWIFSTFDSLNNINEHNGAGESITSGKQSAQGRTNDTPIVIPSAVWTNDNGKEFFAYDTLDDGAFWDWGLGQRNSHGVIVFNQIDLNRPIDGKGRGATCNGVGSGIEIKCELDVPNADALIAMHEAIQGGTYDTSRTVPSIARSANVLLSAGSQLIYRQNTTDVIGSPVYQYQDVSHQYIVNQDIGALGHEQSVLLESVSPASVDSITMPPPGVQPIVPVVQPAVPEASTWMMLILGFTAYSLVMRWRGGLCVATWRSTAAFSGSKLED